MAGINNFLIGMGRIFTRYRVPVLVFLLAVGVWLSMGINHLKVDTNPDHYFPKNSRLRIANTEIGEAFGGSTQMNILVEGDIFDPQVLRNIEMLTDHV